MEGALGFIFNLGFAYTQSGQSDIAMKIYEDGLKIAKQIGEKY